ncbi:hypothetical protein J6590_084151 [Homalodisca vitripennis]|nr:hypothetical protein J6590_084151 [Homalodisca vitripennis]
MCTVHHKGRAKLVAKCKSRGADLCQGNFTYQPAELRSNGRSYLVFQHVTVLLAVYCSLAFNEITINCPLKIPEYCKQTDGGLRLVVLCAARQKFLYAHFETVRTICKRSTDLNECHLTLLTPFRGFYISKSLITARCSSTVQFSSGQNVSSIRLVVFELGSAWCRLAVRKTPKSNQLL